MNMPTHSKPYIQLFENSDILIYSLKKLQINSCAWSWEHHRIKMVFMGTPSYKRLNLQSYLPTLENKKIISTSKSTPRITQNIKLFGFFFFFKPFYGLLPYIDTKT